MILRVSTPQGADFEIERRKSGSACLNGGLHFERKVRKAGCSCSACDVECDFGWVMDLQETGTPCRPINSEDIPKCKVSKISGGAKKLLELVFLLRRDALNIEIINW